MYKGYTLKFVAFIFLIIMQSVYSEWDNRIQSSSELSEYCLDEEFQISCLKNEVVAMKMAIYGRMKIGRCLQDEGQEMLTRIGNDPKFLGCYLDILDIMDEKCSGKQSCTVRLISDIDQKIIKPCHAALRSYLEVSHDCVPVIEPDRTCTVSVTSSAQHLMTSHSSSTKLSCGSRHQPWKLEAPAGQQINVSLLDFGGAVNQRDGHCLQYGYIIDSGINRNVSICGVKKSRKIAIYQSFSNELTVVLNGDISESSLNKVLVGVKAVGCTDMVPPEDMWLRRRNQEAVVGCYSSRQTWYLNCVSNQWLGTIGNCTREDLNAAPSTVMKEEPTITSEVIVSLCIAAVGAIICTLIIVSGIVCLKRYQVGKLKELHLISTNENEWPKNTQKHQMLQGNLQPKFT